MATTDNKLLGGAGLGYLASLVKSEISDASSDSMKYSTVIYTGQSFLNENPCPLAYDGTYYLYANNASNECLAYTSTTTGLYDWTNHTFSSSGVTVGSTVALGTTFCISASTCYFLSTDHGNSWTQYSYPETFNGKYIQVFNGRFIYGYWGNYSTVYYYSSTDGITWTKHTVGTAGDEISNWAFANNRIYFFIRYSGTGLYHEDFTTSGTFSYNYMYASWCSMAYGNGKYVMINSNGANTYPHFASSSDGITFTEFSTSYDNWRSILFANGKFVALGPDNVIGWSKDGSSWSYVTAPYNLNHLQYTNNRFIGITVVVGSFANIIHTRDAIVWSTQIVQNNTNITSSVDALMTTRELVSNKVTSISGSSTDTQYPSAKAVNTSLAGKEDTTNKQTSLTSASTDTQYPSAKATYDFAKARVFIATYNTTSYADVLSALNDGKICFVDYTEDGTVYRYQMTQYKLSSNKIYLSAFYDEVYSGRVTVKLDDDGDTVWSMSSTQLENEDNKVTSISSSSTDTEYPSAKCVYDSISSASGVPSGVIVMWSGASSAIPSGWYLCDGTNNTPNLVDRFIVGAGSTYAVGATGGEATHTLSVSEMPSHSHDMNYSTGGTSGSYVNMYVSLADTRNTYSGIVVNTGGGQAHNNLPPYYALCYIMKG